MGGVYMNDGINVPEVGDVIGEGFYKDWLVFETQPGLVFKLVEPFNAAVSQGNSDNTPVFLRARQLRENGHIGARPPSEEEARKILAITGSLDSTRCIQTVYLCNFRP